MLVRTIPCAVLTGLLVLAAAPAPAQVLKDLEAVTLVYRIDLEGEPGPIGSMTISFTPVDTKRGRRLEVKSERDYTLPLAAPFHYHDEVEMMCDEDGVRSFQSTLEAGGTVRRNTALLSGEDFHVTTDFDGRTEQRTITAGVRRTDIGMFCAGFLAERIDQGPVIQDWPWLVPASADHQPRQKIRESKLPMQIPGGPPVSIVVTRFRRLDDQTDRMVHVANAHGILLRLEEQIPYGTLVHALETVNGVPYAESELVR